MRQRPSEELHSFFKERLRRIWEEAYAANKEAITDLIGKSPGVVLDLGCGDGSFTEEIGRATGASELLGIEIASELAAEAQSKGIQVNTGNLNQTFPLEDACADIVVMNQVIEHINDTDNLLSETYRVLKARGSAVISTENLASWHNIIALSLGWQPFSLTNISTLSSAVGNPFGAHRGEAGIEKPLQHQRLFAPRGLSEIAALHGFEVSKMVGVGYFPLWGKAAALFSNIDARHSSFMIFKIRKEN